MIYNKNSDDYSSQIIRDLFTTGYYGHVLNCWGENSRNENFYSIRFYLIDYIKDTDDGIEIKHIGNTKSVFIKNPSISITKGKISCASCIYACQTQYIPAEYYDEDPQHRGFCMMTGKDFYDIFYGTPCGYYKKGENNVCSE